MDTMITALSDPDAATGRMHELDARAPGCVSADAGFIDILQRSGASLIVTMAPSTIGCIGAVDGELVASLTPHAGMFGVAHQAGRLAVASQRQVIVYALSRRLAAHYPQNSRYHDGIFVPIGIHLTGDCSIHDLVLDGPSVVCVNTKFSCIARCDMLGSFTPIWRPPFISALMPEDRCHLNSFAIVDGKLRYVTAFAQTNTRQGYRDTPLESGVVIEVETGRVVVGGLVKPHSVRVFDNKVYVLNSGLGEVLQLDPMSGRTHVLARLPGFTRGMFAIGNVLLVGLSSLRETATMLGLPLAALGNELIVGVAALDRGTGAVLGLLRLPQDIHEVCDFTVVPGLRRGLVQPPGQLDIGIETPTGSYWMRETAMG